MKVLLLMGMCILALACEKVEKSPLTFEKLKPTPNVHNERSGTNQDGSQTHPDQQDDDTRRPAQISCVSLCKEKNHFRKIENDGYSFLSFPNFGYRGVGRCRGHAILTQKMTILADFEPNLQRCDLADLECVQSYRESIYNIRNFKSFKIPGFKNLLEFSSHPKIEPILKGIVAGTPNRYKTWPAYIEDTGYGTEELNNFFEIKRRLALGQFPYVGVFGLLTGNHGLVAYEDTFKGSDNIICVKDPNVVLETAENCDNYFYVKEDKIYYSRVGREVDELTKFSLTGDEDDRVEKYEQALMDRCIEDLRSQNLCK